VIAVNGGPSDLEEPWVSELRKEMIDEGHDAGRVDQVIEASLEQLESGRVRDFVPVLVERSVHRALRANGQHS
jgi:hypothetical protein